MMSLLIFILIRLYHILTTLSHFDENYLTPLKYLFIILNLNNES